MLDAGNTSNNVIQLGHEAYRDGMESNNQYKETVNAVIGHTALAARMKDAGMDFDTSGLLGAEIDAYNRGDMNALVANALTNYDSSGDYWKLMENGSLMYDGDGWLKDANDNLILGDDGKPIGARGVEGGLAKILGISSSQAQILLNDFDFSSGGAVKTPWETDKNTNREITLNNALYAQKYNQLLVQHNTLNIYNQMIENGLMDYTSIDYSVVQGDGNTWNGRLPQVNYISYDEWKANNFISGNPADILDTKVSPVDSNNVTSPYGIRKDPFTGELSTHTGPDTGVPSGTPFKPISPGTITSITSTNWGGNMLTMSHELPYTFKGQKITTTLFTEYLHLQNNSAGKPDILFAVGSYVDENTVVGFTGNTGLSTGPHIHSGTYFTQQNPLQIWLQRQNYELIKRDRGIFYNRNELKQRNP